MTESSRDRLEQSLSRISDSKGEGARACLTVYAENARKAAAAADARAKSGRGLGPLDGAILTIKDLFDVAGEVTRAGSRVLEKRSKPAAADAVVVSRLREAGAVIVAKTNMTEFAYSGHRHQSKFWHAGQSGGPRACAGWLVLRRGGGGGRRDVRDRHRLRHRRLDAYSSGVLRRHRLQPTVKRVPREGAFPLSFTLDSIGPIAKSVADCANADAVMAGETPAPLADIDLGGVRAGFAQGLPIEGLDEIVGKTFPQALAKLSPQWKGSDIALDALEFMNAANARGGIVPPEAYAIHRELMKEDAEGLDPNVRARLARSVNAGAADYILAMQGSRARHRDDGRGVRQVRRAGDADHAHRRADHRRGFGTGRLHREEHAGAAQHLDREFLRSVRDLAAAPTRQRIAGGIDAGRPSRRRPQAAGDRSGGGAAVGGLSAAENGGGSGFHRRQDAPAVF